MLLIAYVLFLWSWVSVDNWDGDDDAEVPVDDMPDLLQL